MLLVTYKFETNKNKQTKYFPGNWLLHVVNYYQAKVQGIY